MAPSQMSPGPTSQALNVDPQAGRALAAIDKKIIPKPSIYSGAVREYVGWNDGFKDFLETQDERWRPLLEEIEKTGADTMTEERMMQIENMESLDVKGQVKEFSKQLYTYMKAYTKSSAETLLVNNGQSKSFETWRSLADKGGPRARRMSCSSGSGY